MTRRHLRWVTARFFYTLFSRFTELVGATGLEPATFRPPAAYGGTSSATENL